MYQNGDLGAFGFLGISTLPFLLIFSIFLWSLAWKGWALWLAARRDEPVWFLALLVINSFGLLEIVYIFIIAKQKDTREAVASTPSTLL